MNGPSHITAALFPVSQVLELIDLRLRRLNIDGVSLTDLRQHVRTRQSHLNEAASAQHSAEGLYFQASLANRLRPRSPSARCHRSFVKDALSLLESAVQVCERARAPQPKPLRLLLEEALDLCRQFDKVEKLHEGRQRACTAGPVLGGFARQAKLEPARRRTARLLLVKAPPEGWDDPAHAARTVEPGVAAFVRSRQLNMWGQRRTIVRWIRKHPAVRAAYLATRRDQP